MSSSTSSTAERPAERTVKVRFERPSQATESPKARWRRIGRLSLGRRRQKHSQPPGLPIAFGGMANTSEEESSSNSTGEQMSRTREMAPSGTRSVSQAGNSNLTIHSSSSTSPAVVSLDGKAHKSRTGAGDLGRMAQGMFCLCGLVPVETGTQLFLLSYFLLSACGVAFGSVDTMVWILVPLVVIPLALYSLSRHASKYLYPFLVISVVHSLVALLMVLFVGCFTLLCFDRLKAHFAHSLASSTSSPSSSIALCSALTMTLTLGLGLFFFWQSLVIFSCIAHFDLLAQQQQQEQQPSKAHSLASAPLPDHRLAAIAVSRQTDERNRRGGSHQPILDYSTVC